ncbi:MAG TPA: ABC transporter permease [Vicinamibacterales bacterium]|nr:ABC transporter permease [Vicinamibacterales bacterium]
MRAIDYALRQAWSSLWRSRVATLFAVIAIALAMTVLGALLLVTWNAQRLLAQWTDAAEFSVYLRDDATSEQRGAIEALLDQSGIATGREYVSKAQALAQFRREFTGLASLANGFPDNPFPASLEVQLRPDAEHDGRAASLVTRIGALPGVADVRYDREWLARFEAAVRTVRAAGLGLVLLMAIAAGVTVAAVVRLGLYARRDEIEIMSLVGAPFTFIRGPFVAEGLLQGGLGALAALALLAVGFGMTRAWWAADLNNVLGGSSLQFLPLSLWGWLIGGGMLVGSAGGFVAARRAG